MDAPTAYELQEAREPISSLMNKSVKALQKLTPGTWQHRMLQENVAALRIASELMNERAGGAHRFQQDELQKALNALASMVARAEKAQAGFAPGVPSIRYNRTGSRLSGSRKQ